MPSSRQIVLCRYCYDALDRLAATEPLSTTAFQRFYCKSRLATEIQGEVTHSIFQHDDQLLAQQQSGGNTSQTTLLATDQQRSVLHAFNASPSQPIAYSPYGHRPAHSGLLSLLGFNGERRDPVTGHYLLGNGYRAFNPVLMRFNSPDSWSPFGKGGLNPYAYCLGDPINQSDPMGHSPIPELFKQLTPRYLNRAITGSVQKTLIKATARKMNSAGLLSAQVSNGKNTKNFAIIHPKKYEVIAEAKRKSIDTMLRKGAESERELRSTGKINPLTVNIDRGAATKKLFDLQRSGFPTDADSIPKLKTPITATNASGQEYLRTDFYDDAASFFHHEAITTNNPAYKARQEQLAGKTLIKRAEYIRRYADLDY